MGVFDIGGSAKKVGRRIKELERLYGIQHGGNRSNQDENSSPCLKTQSQLASDMGMDVRTLQNYKMLSDMIPELEELVDTGIYQKVFLSYEPWFVGKDVADALGYKRATKAIQDHVDFEDKDEIPIQDSIGRMQSTPIISESGLYALIFGSKLEAAKRFIWSNSRP